MVSIVNVVGAGTLGVEIDLSAVEGEITAQTARYDPETHPGLYLRFTTDGPMITVYRTGRYHITGAESPEELFETHEDFLNAIQGLSVGIAKERCLDSFSIRNIVCTAEYPTEINLNAAAIGLGLENTEYEPEQFPGLVYRIQNPSAVLLLFASGKVVITGVSDVDSARDAFAVCKKRLDSVFTDN